MLDEKMVRCEACRGAQSRFDGFRWHACEACGGKGVVPAQPAPITREEPKHDPSSREDSSLREEKLLPRLISLERELKCSHGLLNRAESMLRQVVMGTRNGCQSWTVGGGSNDRWLFACRGWLAEMGDGVGIPAEDQKAPLTREDHAAEHRPIGTRADGSGLLLNVGAPDVGIPVVEKGKTSREVLAQVGAHTSDLSAEIARLKAELEGVRAENAQGVEREHALMSELASHPRDDGTIGRILTAHWLNMCDKVKSSEEGYQAQLTCSHVRAQERDEAIERAQKAEAAAEAIGQRLELERRKRDEIGERLEAMAGQRGRAVAIIEAWLDDRDPVAEARALLVEIAKEKGVPT